MVTSINRPAPTTISANLPIWFWCVGRCMSDAQAYCMDQITNYVRWSLEEVDKQRPYIGSLLQQRVHELLNKESAE